MDGTLLTTTRNADFVALGTGGQRVVRCWDQISGYLEQSIGPAHARLFAEPTYNAAAGTTDWYAAGPGEVLRLADLPAEEQEPARTRLGSLLEQLRAAVERLKQSKREDERVLSELLSLALIIPDDSAVWVQRRAVGEPGDGAALQPVLVGWGQTLNGQEPAPELLLGIAAGGYRPRAGRAPMRIVGPPPPVAPPSRWGLWGLLGGLLLALPFFLLLLWRDPFAWFQVPAAQCVIAPDHIGRVNELREAEAREARLRQEIARVALELGNRRTACPAPPAPPAQPATPPPAPQQRAEPTPPAPSPDVRRAQERGARTGALQIILAWEDLNDLDLHVICPRGETIDYTNRRACGGELDTDANFQPPLTTTPVENIAFARAPANGTYRIAVSHVPGPGPASSPFRVTIRQEGRPDRVINGRVSRGQRVDVGSVSVPP
jgi:hypothetical protein